MSRHFLTVQWFRYRFIGRSETCPKEEREFWEQPRADDGLVFRPCLDFSTMYRKASAKISQEKKWFLVVVVSGGLNQQRNQIVDAVVIARILEAALVVPVLQVNRVWEDESEFSEIFDVEHFKKTLKADVRVVSTLPSTHLVPRQSVETQLSSDVSATLIRARFLKQVAFHALRFAPIRELGNRITRRMWIEGQYISVHLRLEKDVWMRAGCLTGLGPEYDNIIAREGDSHPEFLTGKLNMSRVVRRLAGLCPLNAFEVARPGNARLYLAGGEPFGGSKALEALEAEFPNVVSKEMLVQDGELKPFKNRSSVLAAIDYIVSLSSDVLLPSHGGNMAKALQGHRAYVGHRKYITPNQRMIIRLFEEPSISDAEIGRILSELHMRSQGQPKVMLNKRERDVIAFPVPECMCKH